MDYKTTFSRSFSSVFNGENEVCNYEQRRVFSFLLRQSFLGKVRRECCKCNLYPFIPYSPPPAPGGGEWWGSRGFQGKRRNFFCVLTDKFCKEFFPFSCRTLLFQWARHSLSWKEIKRCIKRNCEILRFWQQHNLEVEACAHTGCILNNA